MSNLMSSIGYCYNQNGSDFGTFSVDLFQHDFILVKHLNSEVQSYINAFNQEMSSPLLNQKLHKLSPVSVQSNTEDKNITSVHKDSTCLINSPNLSCSQIVNPNMSDSVGVRATTVVSSDGMSKDILSDNIISNPSTDIDVVVCQSHSKSKQTDSRAISNQMSSSVCAMHNGNYRSSKCNCDSTESWNCDDDELHVGDSDTNSLASVTVHSSIINGSDGHSQSDSYNRLHIVPYGKTSGIQDHLSCLPDEVPLASQSGESVSSVDEVFEDACDFDDFQSAPQILSIANGLDTAGNQRNNGLADIDDWTAAAAGNQVNNWTENDSSTGVAWLAFQDAGSEDERNDPNIHPVIDDNQSDLEEFFSVDHSTREWKKEIFDILKTSFPSHTSLLSRKHDVPWQNVDSFRPNLLEVIDESAQQDNPDNTTPDSIVSGNASCSAIWNNLKVMEDTAALKFTWNNSHSNKLLLKSVKVESPNRLSGNRMQRALVSTVNPSSITSRSCSLKPGCLPVAVKISTRQPNESTVSKTIPIGLLNHSNHEIT